MCDYNYFSIFFKKLEIPLQNLSILVSSEILLLFIGTLRSALISNLLLQCQYLVLICLPLNFLKT